MATSADELSLLILKTDKPVGCVGSQNETDFEYTGPKQGGTDIGHRVLDVQTAREYLVKTGMTLGLFYKILQAQHLGNESKVSRYFGFLAGSYERISGSLSDNQRREKLIAYFKRYCETSDGSKLLEKTHSESFTIRDIYNVYYSYLAELEKDEDPTLKEVICLSALEDVIKGAASQAFSNQFQSRHLLPKDVPIATIIVEKTPDDERAALLLATGFIENAIGFDRFLINPFLDALHAGGDDWVERGALQLKIDLEKKPVRGLCAAILLRHIMGEKSDNSPDNMVLIDTGEVRRLINIDLTGFRYNRQKIEESGLGWEDILLTNNKAELIEKLLHPDVLSNRFVLFCDELPEDKREEIYSKINELIKISVAPYVKSEIKELRQWLSGLDAEFMEEFVSQLTRTIVDAMNARFKPSDDAIAQLQRSNRFFISKAVGVVKANPQLLTSGKETFFNYEMENTARTLEQTFNVVLT